MESDYIYFVGEVILIFKKRYDLSFLKYWDHLRFFFPPQKKQILFHTVFGPVCFKTEHWLVNGYPNNSVFIVHFLEKKHGCVFVLYWTL